MNKKSKIIILSVLLILIITSVFIYIYVRKKGNKTEEEIVKTIEKYNYTLKNNQSKLYVDLFNELDDKTESKVLDEEKVVELIAKLFVLDFYNLDNKISKNDIGGLQFVHESMVDNFTLKATNTIYKYIESNIYGNRKQKLPVVISVTTKDISNKKYTYLDKTDDNAYLIDLEITYQEDLDYPTGVNIIIVKDDNKYKIVEVN